MRTLGLASRAALTVAGAVLSLPGLGGEIHAVIDGVRGPGGHVLCQLFRSAQGFPNAAQHAFKPVSVAADAGEVRCEFRDLPAGTYAISVFHDVNDDGILNTNLVGLPQEGYGFSNNHTYATHPASFEESQFTLDAQDLRELRIRLKY
jgi:uncharacterized protein (DUF2141 family)